MHSRLLLKQVNIFNVETARFMDSQDIFIENGLIAAIGRIDLNEEPGVKFVDCQGKYALSGLWECHGHLAAFTVTGEEHRHGILKEFGYKDTHAWDDFLGDQLKKFLVYGITHVRDVGGPVCALNSLNQSIANGKYPGPELHFSGPMLEKSPLAWGDDNAVMPGFTVKMDTREDVDSIMPLLRENGARLVKTFNKFDDDIYEYLIRKAEMYGFPVTHDPGTVLFHQVPMTRAMDLGVRCFEHVKCPLPCVLMPDLKEEHDALIGEDPESPAVRVFSKKVFSAGTDAIDKVALDTLLNEVISKNVFICPTLQTMETLKIFIAADSENKDQEEKKRVAKQWLEIQFLLAETMIKKGVKILVGHDGCMADNTIQEMELLSSCGMTEAEIIKGATLYPAQWLGINDKLGSIEENKIADIVLLNQNPLERISHIRSVFAVIQNGKWMDVV